MSLKEKICEMEEKKLKGERELKDTWCKIERKERQARKGVQRRRVARGRKRRYRVQD
jgi:hypothetical protein